MTAPSLLAALSLQLPQILEAAAFITVERLDAPLPQPGPAVEARLSFSGLRGGTCWLAVDSEGAVQLAADMLGTEPVDDPLSHEHALSEILNILATWFLDAWWGEDVARRVETPTSSSQSFPDTTAWSLPDERRVIVLTESGHTYIYGVTLDD